MSTSLRPTPWLAHLKPRPVARLRLFCFPYAGGSAAIYRTWSERLPAEVEVLPVELPGRASRFREPLLRRVDDVVRGAAEALGPLFDRPYAFFGHSMGALLAFELARQLAASGRAMPARLLVSARRAPHLADDDEPPIHSLPEPELLAKLRELNGTPEEALQHPELMQMLLPLLRADFEVNETYEYRDGAPLAVPISVFGGVEDEEVPRETLDAWREHTTAGCLVRILPGDHFFLNHDPQRTSLLTAILQDLGPFLAR